MNERIKKIENSTFNRIDKQDYKKNNKFYFILFYTFSRFFPCILFFIFILFRIFKNRILKTSSSCWIYIRMHWTHTKKKFIHISIFFCFDEFCVCGCVCMNSIFTSFDNIQQLFIHHITLHRVCGCVCACISRSNLRLLYITEKNSHWK